MISFEHKAAAAKSCRSAQCHAAFADSLVAVELVHDSIAPVPVSAFEVHCFKGDATNQDAIGKEKVHTSLVSSSLLATFPDLDVYSFDQSRLETVVDSSRQSGDLQVVKVGNGAETYQLIKSEFASLGTPTWETRAQTVVPGLISAFLFGLDNGPDNVGMLKRIRAACKGHRQCMYAVIWCTCHQNHLIVKGHLTAMQTQQVTGYELSCNYFTAITSIVHVWRSSGMQDKLAAASLEQFDTSVCFKRLPGRPLRGRWGAIEDAEKCIVLARSQLKVLFDKLVVVPKKAAARAALGDDEDNYQERNRAYKLNALAALHNPAFLLLVMVSRESRSPLDHLFAWNQKRVREHNKSIEKHAALGRRFLGNTPFADLVLTKLDFVAASFNDILLAINNLFFLNLRIFKMLISGVFLFHGPAQPSAAWVIVTHVYLYTSGRVFQYMYLVGILDTFTCNWMWYQVPTIY